MKSDDTPAVEILDDGEIQIKVEAKLYRRKPGWDWELWVPLPARRWQAYYAPRGTWRQVSGKNVLAKLTEISGQHTQGERE